MTEKTTSWVVPFGGNAFITSKFSPDTPDVIRASGIMNWVSDTTNVSLYFHMQYPGKLLAALRLRVPSGSSRISFSLTHNYKNQEGQMTVKRETDISGSDFQLVNCGIFNIPVAGYVRMDLRGLERTGSTFGLVTHAVFLSESSLMLDQNILRCVEDPLDYHFGRRGASVHMNYVLPAASEIQYFYNEIYVPKNQDVIGTDFCAIGFTGGQFGIQVTSKQERRVFFSIWSDFNTENPYENPEDYNVKLIRKGENVFVGKFENQGSGVQSLWRHMWQPEKTYKFIVLTTPFIAGRTMYTAWFNSSEPSYPWKLIASFEKPKVSTFFQEPHSFTQNSIPEMGHVERHCIFSNQWAYGEYGTWTEITRASFTTGDAGSRKIRMDIGGGVGIDGDERNFFLKTCGFFSERVEPNTTFNRKSSGDGPPLDVAILP